VFDCRIHFIRDHYQCRRASMRVLRPSLGLRTLGSLWSICLLGAALLAVPTSASEQSLIEGAKAGFGGSLIVPQVIQRFEPLGFLHVIYGDKNHRIDVGPAAQLPPERLVHQPLIAFNLTEEYRERMSPPYVLIMIDADSSAAHTSQSCALHWMITDIYLDKKTGLMTNGFLSAAYRRPNPPEGQLHHRYVFLLYAQPLLFIPPIFPASLIGPRLHFNLDAFVFDFGLGEPLGGNFLKSFFDNVEIPEEELVQPKKPTYVAKSGSSPFLAGVIGSIMGVLYAASA